MNPIIDQILQIRELILTTYKRLEVFIQPVLKFFVGLFVFNAIMGIDHVHPALAGHAETMTSTLVVWLLALLFTVMPTSLGWLAIILAVVVQLSATVELAAVVFLFLLFMFLFYARMAPRESILILFTMMAFHFNVPYLVPLLVGLYFPVSAIIPVTLGTFVYAQIPNIHVLMAPSATLVDVELGDLPAMLPEIAEGFYGTLLSGIGVSQEWLITAVVFALVIILVYVTSRQAIDFAKEIAIGLGCIMTIFGFIMAVLVADDVSVGIGGMILMTILCGIIALIVRFFDSVLDYSRAEAVQFEDDDNYYHVRIVPKMLSSKPLRLPQLPRRTRPEASVEDIDGTRPTPTARPRPPHLSETRHSKPRDTETSSTRAVSDETRAMRPVPDDTRLVRPVSSETRVVPSAAEEKRPLPPVTAVNRTTTPVKEEKRPKRPRATEEELEMLRREQEKGREELLEHTRKITPITDDSANTEEPRRPRLAPLPPKPKTTDAPARED